MKNYVKALGCIGVSCAGYALMKFSDTVVDGKIVTDIRRFVPGTTMLVYGLLFAGAYEANPEFKVITNKKLNK